MGINGPDLRALWNDENMQEFIDTMQHSHATAFIALKDFVDGVFGKNRVARNEIATLVKQLLHKFSVINATMNLKLHFLHRHLDVFLDKLPVDLDAQGEEFHLVCERMEKQWCEGYGTKKLDAMLGDECWKSHTVIEYERSSPSPIDEGDGEGHTERHMPMNPFHDPEHDDVDD